jgi:hypothetical protein
MIFEASLSVKSFLGSERVMSFSGDSAQNLFYSLGAYAAVSHLHMGKRTMGFGCDHKLCLSMIFTPSIESAEKQIHDSSKSRSGAPIVVFFSGQTRTCQNLNDQLS